MSSKFVRLKADLEIAINLENISHVVKGENVVFVHFIGSTQPLTLTTNVAELLWRCIKGSSLGVASYAKNQGEASALVSE